MAVTCIGLMRLWIMSKEDRIVVPDAAIREYNEKYGKYLPKIKHVPVPVDEDAMYLQAMGLSTDN